MIEQMEMKHAQEIQALKTEQAKAFDTNLNILKKDWPKLSHLKENFENIQTMNGKRHAKSAN